MSLSIAEKLAKFEPRKGEKYDPGQIVIFFDNRTYTSPHDKFSYLQSYWTESLYKLGWPSLRKPDLEPGNIRLVWYTHVGNEGTRDFPLYKAYLVKDMYDSLSQEGFRPMILGWSVENPFPMIGGVEPPPAPEKPKIKVATTWSGGVSGHRNTSTPHERVMAIITEEERREAEERRKQVEKIEDMKGIESPV